jgi:stringent starvation protein B
MTARSELTPLRPHLVRAYYDWILENNLTPYVMVDAEFPNVEVPRDFVRDGRIILNIMPRAIHNFELTDTFMAFRASFRGQSMNLYLPMGAILALYAQENRAGAFFDPEPLYKEQKEAAAAQASLAPVEDAKEDKPSGGVALVTAPKLESVDGGAQSEPQSDDGDGDDDPPPRGRPTLRVIK